MTKIKQPVVDHFKAGDFTRGKMNEIFTQAKDRAIINHKQHGEFILQSSDSMMATLALITENLFDFRQVKIKDEWFIFMPNEHEQYVSDGVYRDDDLELDECAQSELVLEKDNQTRISVTFAAFTGIDGLYDSFGKYPCTTLQHTIDCGHLIGGTRENLDELIKYYHYNKNEYGLLKVHPRSDDEEIEIYRILNK